MICECIVGSHISRPVGYDDLGNIIFAHADVYPFRGHFDARKFMPRQQPRFGSYFIFGTGERRAVVHFRARERGYGNADRLDGERAEQGFDRVIGRNVRSVPVDDFC